MPVFKDKTREIIVKIVYYGPGLAGKTTSLKYLHQQAHSERRGEIHVWGNEADTILDFDLLPPSLSEIKKFKLHFQMYTIPGQVKSNRSRKFILEGVDAIVFVADSQGFRQKANLVSLGNLKENLRANELSLNDILLVYEYNKRDLRDILSIIELNQDLNPTDRYPYVETIATKGKGVLRAFEIVSNLVIRNLNAQLQHIEEETSSESDELPGLPGFPDWEESLDFAAELEPVTSSEEQQASLSYVDLLVETYHDGEIIFEEGGFGGKLYFIESGQVKIVASSKLITNVLAVYHTGEFFGEMVLFGENFGTARAVAIGTTNLLPITKERLASQIHHRPKIAESFLGTLSNRIRKENETIGELLEQNKELRQHLKKAQKAAKHFMEQQKGQNIVECTFKHGVDWQAFLVSLHQLSRQIKVKNKEAAITVQSIENKREGGLNVNIAVPQGIDRNKIYRAFQAQYKRQLALQRAKYQAVWQGNEKIIALCRQQAVDMQKIISTLSRKQYVNSSLVVKNLDQLHTKEELTYLYTQISQNIAELRRRYIHENDLTTRAKLKAHIKKTEAKLIAIEQRLDSP